MSVQAVEEFSPYSNVVGQFTEGLPTWLSRQDGERIAAYQIYEQIYWNVPETFKLVLRGEENASPIYIPTARTIVDTTNRYLCPNPAFIVDDGLGSPEEQEACRLAYSGLFRRERFWSQFQANKLYGVMRGDWLWHVIGNPNKPPGRRIKIETVDPASYIPVSHPNDPDILIGAHIVEQILDEEDNIFVKRQSYWKGADPYNNDGSDTTIYNSIGLYDLESWEGLDLRPVTVIKPPTALPAAIKAIPIYHIPNIQTPGDPFGSSEIRGFERIMAAVNQAVSDEEIALALEGLGMYHTDGGPPLDDNNQPTDWVLGPGRVVEHTLGSQFERVNGINSVAPVQDHLKFLIQQLKEASATPDVAVGRVDVTVAESGIALVMQMAPMLAKVEVREELIIDVHEQFFYDLRDWFAAYEGFVTPCIVHPLFGDRLPVNRAEAIKEILDIFNAGLADIAWAQAELGKLGFQFDADSPQKILTEAAARAKATDPFASRMESEFGEEGAEQA